MHHQYGRHGSAYDIIKITYLLYVSSGGVLALVITTLVWTFVDPYDHNQWFTLMFQAILRASEFTAVLPVAYAVHPIRRTGMKQFLAVLRGEDVILTSFTTNSTTGSKDEVDLTLAKTLQPVEKTASSVELMKVSVDSEDLNV